MLLLAVAAVQMRTDGALEWAPAIEQAEPVEVDVAPAVDPSAFFDSRPVALGASLDAGPQDLASDALQSDSMGASFGRSDAWQDQSLLDSGMLTGGWERGAVPAPAPRATQDSYGEPLQADAANEIYTITWVPPVASGPAKASSFAQVAVAPDVHEDRMDAEAIAEMKREGQDPQVLEDFLAGKKPQYVMPKDLDLEDEWNQEMAPLSAQLHKDEKEMDEYALTPAAVEEMDKHWAPMDKHSKPSPPPAEASLLENPRPAVAVTGAGELEALTDVRTKAQGGAAKSVATGRKVTKSGVVAWTPPIG